MKTEKCLMHKERIAESFHTWLANGYRFGLCTVCSSRTVRIEFHRELKKEIETRMKQGDKNEHVSR